MKVDFLLASSLFPLYFFSWWFLKWSNIGSMWLWSLLIYSCIGFIITRWSSKPGPGNPPHFRPFPTTLQNHKMSSVTSEILQVGQTQHGYLTFLKIFNFSQNDYDIRTSLPFYSNELLVSEFFILLVFLLYIINIISHEYTQMENLL